MNSNVSELIVRARNRSQYLTAILARSTDRKMSDLSDAERDEMYSRVLIELTMQQCVEYIESYRIPVGNSASGELACEWTYDALKEIRDEIHQHFGVENDR